MTTAYQNWQNSTNTSEQYMTTQFMLERAEADTVFDDGFTEYPHDQRSGRSLRMPRFAVPATNTTAVTEGVSNASRNLVLENQYVTLSEYIESFSWTSQAENMDPVDYAAGAAEVGHDLVKLDRNALRWALMCSGSNRIYNASTISARTSVTGVLTAGRVDQGITILESAKAKVFSELLLGSNRIGSTGLMPSYLAYGHTHLRPDIEAMRGFIPASAYPSDVRKNQHEIGALAGGRVRVILSSEASPIADAGAAKGSQNLRSTSGTSVDVYPFVIIGKGALGCVPLRKRGSKGKGNVQVYKVDQPDRVDPGNLSKFWSAVWTEGFVITNDLWVLRIEVACTAAYT